MSSEVSSLKTECDAKLRSLQQRLTREQELKYKTEVLLKKKQDELDKLKDEENKMMGETKVCCHVGHSQPRLPCATTV